MTNDEQLRRHHRYWGRWYGYPECCVEAFVNDIAAGERYPGMKRLREFPYLAACAGDWFCVPCAECAPTYRDAKRGFRCDLCGRRASRYIGERRTSCRKCKPRVFVK